MKDELVIKVESLEEVKQRTEKMAEKIDRGIEPDEKYVLSLHPDTVSQILSGKRMEILLYLANNKPRSIRKLAEKLERNYKSVYNDLKLLEKNQLLELEKGEKQKSPVEIKMPYSKITVDFEKKAQT